MNLFGLFPITIARAFGFKREARNCFKLGHSISIESVVHIANQ